MQHDYCVHSGSSTKTEQSGGLLGGKGKCFPLLPAKSQPDQRSYSDLQNQVALCRAFMPRTEASLLFSLGPELSLQSTLPASIPPSLTPLLPDTAPTCPIGDQATCYGADRMAQAFLPHAHNTLHSVFTTTSPSAMATKHKRIGPFWG